MLLDSFLAHAMRGPVPSEGQEGSDEDKGASSDGGQGGEGANGCGLARSLDDEPVDSGETLRDAMLFEPHTHNIITVDKDTVARLFASLGANGNKTGRGAAGAPDSAGEVKERDLERSVTRITIDTTAPPRSLYVCAEART